VTKPYYQDDLVTLYHGDSLEVLPGLGSGSAHHVVTDPPYILQAGSSGKVGSKTGGWADMMNASYWFTAWYKECARILRGTGSLWSFGNWRTLPAMQRAAIDADLPATSLLVWDKASIGPAGPQALRSQHEICMVMAKEAFKLPDRSQGDVLRVQGFQNKSTGHPAEKPIALLRRVTELTGAGPGDVILDPFTGSGTGLVAARELGMRAVGIEAEERWCEVAAERLAQQTLDFSGIAS
jgi:DNA modification methylase